MLNGSGKKIVYLDGETLRYLYYTYTGERTYPVMKKLYTLLAEGFAKDWLVTPLSIDHVSQYIKDNRIDQSFLTMMGSMGQVQYHQRFTIKTLQLIRVLNNFFDMPYNKPAWRDTFASDPDERYRQGFNRYSSLTAMNVSQIVSREKNYSQMIEFIDCFNTGVPLSEMATRHFRSIWEQFPDLVKPIFRPSARRRLTSPGFLKTMKYARYLNFISCPHSLEP